MRDQVESLEQAVGRRFENTAATVDVRPAGGPFPDSPGFIRPMILCDGRGKTGGTGLRKVVSVGEKFLTHPLFPR